ncbi:MAG: DUF4864 domain-containing protein [Allorhizobium sp.]
MGAGVSRILAVVILLCLPLKAFGEDALRSAQSVITEQIQAFLDDDANAAYAFASPQIKARFPDAERFFDMVKRSYEPVYKVGNFAFGRSRIVSGGDHAFQEVLITSPDGKDWAAVYDLERQPDGKYAINGVQMMRDTTSRGI